MLTIAKRGQNSAASAAVLIAIIAALLIMFIILIPPQERANLLDGTGSSGGSIDKTVAQKNVLLENPGRIDFLAQKEIEHPLPVVNIFTRTESAVLAQRNVATVKNGVFSEETVDFPFSIPDLRYTENVLLSFKVNQAQGRIVVTLNGDDVFDAEVTPGAVQPVILPKNTLQEQNTLTFAVSSPGIAFWRTNQASLEKIQVIADVTSLESQASRNVFLASETEKKNLETVELRFQPQCNLLEVGKLKILVNNDEIFNAVPDCEIAMIPLEISPDLINQGENEVIFSTTKGTYQLSHVAILSTLREIDFPTYYFELSTEQYQDILRGNVRLRLTINFVDVIAAKRGELLFNGHQNSFDTKEMSYTLDLSDDAVQGNNVIKIRPKRTLEIRELRVDLVK